MIAPTRRRPLSYVAAAVFIAEGLAILFAPDHTITAFRKRHPWVEDLVDFAIDLHWKGSI